MGRRDPKIQKIDFPTEYTPKDHSAYPGQHRGPHTAESQARATSARRIRRIARKYLNGDLNKAQAYKA